MPRMITVLPFLHPYKSPVLKSLERHPSMLVRVTFTGIWSSSIVRLGLFFNRSTATRTRKGPRSLNREMINRHLRMLEEANVTAQEKLAFRPLDLYSKETLFWFSTGEK